MVSQDVPQQGAPVEAYASRDFIIVNMRAVRELGSWEAAGCFQRIAWRAERDGYWTATMQEIADEIGVSTRTAKRITQTLRDKGWIDAERRDSQVATLTWTVCWADESANLSPALTSESANVAPTPEGQTGTEESANVAPTVSANEALSSTKTEETPETNGATSSGRAKPRKPETLLPDDFTVTDEMKAWFAEQDWARFVTHPGVETQNFMDHHRAKGSKFRDWTAAWRTWMRNAGTKYAAGGGARAPQHPQVDEAHRERVGSLF